MGEAITDSERGQPPMSALRTDRPGRHGVPERTPADRHRRLQQAASPEPAT